MRGELRRGFAKGNAARTASSPPVLLDGLRLVASGEVDAAVAEELAGVVFVNRIGGDAEFVDAARSGVGLDGDGDGDGAAGLDRLVEDDRGAAAWILGATDAGEWDQAAVGILLARKGLTLGNVKFDGVQVFGLDDRYGFEGGSGIGRDGDGEFVGGGLTGGALEGVGADQAGCVGEVAVALGQGDRGEEHDRAEAKNDSLIKFHSQSPEG